MNHKQGLPQRRTIRLLDYDYTQPGAYFVTIVTHRHLCIFGKINDGSVDLSDIGKIVDETWLEIPTHFPNISNEHVVMMPNHLHGVIITHEPTVRNDPVHNVISTTFGTIIGSFKSAVTKKIHKIKGLEDHQVWHRNYYEHVIRDESDFQRIVDYIETNPQNWEKDPEYQSG